MLLTRTNAALRTVRSSLNLSSVSDRAPEASCMLARWETRLQIAARPMIDKEAVQSGSQQPSGRAARRRPGSECQPRQRRT